MRIVNRETGRRGVSFVDFGLFVRVDRRPKLAKLGSGSVP